MNFAVGLARLLHESPRSGAECGVLMTLAPAKSSAGCPPLRVPHPGRSLAIKTQLSGRSTLLHLHRVFSCLYAVVPGAWSCEGASTSPTTSKSWLTASSGWRGAYPIGHIPPCRCSFHASLPSAQSLCSRRFDACNTARPPADQYQCPLEDFKIVEKFSFRSEVVNCVGAYHLLRI